MPLAPLIDCSVKQVLIWRQDLSCRKGKQNAQMCHASIMFLVQNALDGNSISSLERKWIVGGMTKICVRVDSEQELLDVYQKALDANLEVHLITDAGLTEFKEPTRTCIAIGPDRVEKIDKITGELKLL
jgi:PTH2 family peptidyl-tRNA hydrolase